MCSSSATLRLRLIFFFFRGELVALGVFGERTGLFAGELLLGPVELLRFSPRPLISSCREGFCEVCCGIAKRTSIWMNKQRLRIATTWQRIASSMATCWGL